MDLPIPETCRVCVPVAVVCPDKCRVSLLLARYTNMLSDWEPPDREERSTAYQLSVESSPETGWQARRARRIRNVMPQLRRADMRTRDILLY